MTTWSQSNKLVDGSEGHCHFLSCLFQLKNDSTLRNRHESFCHPSAVANQITQSVTVQERPLHQCYSAHTELWMKPKNSSGSASRPKPSFRKTDRRSFSPNVHIRQAGPTAGSGQALPLGVCCPRAEAGLSRRDAGQLGLPFTISSLWLGWLLPWDTIPTIPSLKEIEVSGPQLMFDPTNNIQTMEIYGTLVQDRSNKLLLSWHKLSACSMGY